MSSPISSLFLGPRYDHDDGVREHFFWCSTQTSVYLHIRSPHLFDVSQWYHFALSDRTPREEHSDLLRGMRDARAAWLRFNTLDSLLSQSSHDLRAALGTGDGHYEMFKMNDRRVAAALYEEVQAGRLIFVPDREAMRACMKAIREERQRASQAACARLQQPVTADRARGRADAAPGTPVNPGTAAYSPGTSQKPPSHARPFAYTPDPVDRDTEALAASTNNPDYAARMLGYERQTFGNMIHAMKDDLDLGGADNVIWHDNGDVEFGGQMIGNMHDYQ